MAKKKPLPSQERKALRERRKRASCLAAQSNVKADKKRAWWRERREKHPPRRYLRASQQKRRKRAETAHSEEISRQIATGEYGKRHAGETVCVLLAMLLTWRTIWVGYTRWLHRWFLVGPDTLYIEYSLLCDLFFLVVCLIDFLAFLAVLCGLFHTFFFQEARKKAWDSLKALLQSGWAHIRKAVWGSLLAHGALAALVLAPHLILLLLCFSRTEITTTGTASYFLGIQTSRHAFTELAETEMNISRHENRGVPRYHYALVYTLRFQDGYELETILEASAYHGYVQDYVSLAELNNLVRDMAPQEKHGMLDLYKAVGWGDAWRCLRDNGF